MKKFLLVLALILPMIIVGCSQKNEVDTPKFISSIKGVSIGATVEQAIDSLKSQGYSVTVSGTGIQFIQINEKIALGNFVFDKLTAYAYTSGISNILLLKVFYSESNATSFYNEVFNFFNKEYGQYSSVPNEAQQKAYIKCACWTDSDTDLYLYLEQDEGNWNVGLLLSDHS